MTTRKGHRVGLLAVLLGAVLGLGVLAVFVTTRERPYEEVEVKRPWAADAEVAQWWAEWERRAGPVAAFPDPPGEGPVTSATYRISRGSYPLEVRRRGARVTMGVGGVDEQTLGGGWIAYGEGRITGEDGSFAGAVATITWGCLGLRYRTASDGMARVRFSSDGRTLDAFYVAHETPWEWLKAYGRLDEGAVPPRGTVLGQIPVADRMARLAPTREVRLAVRVVDLEGALVPDALVQVKGLSDTRVHADAEGRATVVLSGADAPWAVSVCAGAAGHRNGETVVFADELRADGATPVLVELARMDLEDHPAYAWIPAAPDDRPDDAMLCGTCHSWQYDEWTGSRHARSANHGHVEWARARMLEEDPEAPDDCRGCHQPAHAVDNPGGGWARRGPIAGVHCDLCHKVAAVMDVHASGAFGALQIARPDPGLVDRPGGIHVVFGPMADATYPYMGSSYAPAMASSHFCAACHQGGGHRLRGRPKLDTFEEWRRWAATREGERFRSCQDCHMPGDTTRSTLGTRVDQVAWDAVHRTPAAVHSHRFEGTSATFVEEALKVEATKRWDADASTWTVEVVLENVGAGHRIPTGTWTKHVAVGVWARAGDAWLVPVGPDRAWLVPADAPTGPQEAGDWRNPNGTVLGVLAAADGRTLVPFWGGAALGDVVDARLEPDAPRRVVASFAGGRASEPPTVEVQVVHRRGPLGAGPADAPWELQAYDPPPQTLWRRIVR